MTGVPAALDHVVLAGPDLAALVDWFEERTGVRAAPGGVHPSGTANALVAFTVAGARGRHYLELIGPDGDARPTTFGIDTLTGPALVTWAAHPDRLDDVVAAARAGGYDPGEIAPLSRRTPSGELLAWRLTGVDGNVRDPLLPFLIDWGSTAHPGLGDLPAVELVGLAGVHPEPEAVRRRLALLGAGDLDVVGGRAASLRLTLSTPAGPVTL